MEPRSENRYWAAVAVECWVRNKLVIQCGLNGFPDMKIVVSFHDFLWVIAQGSVAVEHIRSTRLQKLLVIARSTAHDDGKSPGVAMPMPCIAFDAHAQRGRPISISERKCVKVAISPAETRKQADIH